MNFRRSARWGYDGWAIQTGANVPLAWSLCTTRAEARAPLRAKAGAVCEGGGEGAGGEGSDVFGGCGMNRHRLEDIRTVYGDIIDASVDRFELAPPEPDESLWDIWHVDPDGEIVEVDVVGRDNAVRIASSLAFATGTTYLVCPAQDEDDSTDDYGMAMDDLGFEVNAEGETKWRLA